MIRVLLVNEMRLVSNVIASVLEDESDIEVVGRVTSLDEALEVRPISSWGKAMLARSP